MVTEDGSALLRTDTLMSGEAGRERLAGEVLAFSVPLTE